MTLNVICIQYHAIFYQNYTNNEFVTLIFLGGEIRLKMLKEETDIVDGKQITWLALESRPEYSLIYSEDFFFKFLNSQLYFVLRQKIIKNYNLNITHN